MPVPGDAGSGDPRLVLDRAGLRHTIERLARELDATHDDDTVVIVTLPGALIFASDLIRALRIHPHVDVVAVSPFEPGARAVLLEAPSLELGGAAVVLLTDVIDTAMSLQFLLDDLARRGVASTTVCTLVDKPRRRLVPVEPHHVGVTVDDDFLIGYGLDFAGWYRNLPVLAAGDLRRLTDDPSCYRSWAYGNRRWGSEEPPSSG